MRRGTVQLELLANGERHRWLELQMEHEQLAVVVHGELDSSVLRNQISKVITGCHD